MVGIRELARHLAISTGTVSRALNDKSDVNPLTRQRVREAAAKLGYSPNQAGRSLRRGQMEMVGIIIPTGSDTMLIEQEFQSVLDGLRHELSSHRLDLAIFLQGRDEDLFGSLRRLTERRLVDGVIIADTQHIDPRIDFLIDKRRPFVAFGRSLSGGGHAWVDPDFEGAVTQAVDQLCVLGHRQIALVLPDRHTHYVYLIEGSFRRNLKRRRLRLAAGSCIKSAGSETGGIVAGDALLKSEPRPTAVLLTDASQTGGFYRALGEAGLQPGRDISMVGILPGRKVLELKPTLARLETDWVDVGARLGQALVRELSGQAAPKGVANHIGMSSTQTSQIIVPTVFWPDESLQRVSR